MQSQAWRGGGSGAAIPMLNFAAPGALWYFLAREKVRLTHKTIYKSKAIYPHGNGTGSSELTAPFSATPPPQGSRSSNGG